MRNHTCLKQDKQNYSIADIFLKVLKLLAYSNVELLFYAFLRKRKAASDE